MWWSHIAAPDDHEDDEIMMIYQEYKDDQIFQGDLQGLS